MQEDTQAMKAGWATCSTKGIKAAPLLFDSKLETIINELLQNARRAGATLVRVSVTDSPSPSTICVMDDGRGIEDPQELLSLWESNWGAECTALETPAGAGLFSLCRYGAAIRSRNWMAVLKPECFDGSVPYSIEYFHNSIEGCQVLFSAPDRGYADCKRIVQNAAEYYPVDVVLNDIPVRQRGFLDRALYVREIEGARIGVFRKGDVSRTPYWLGNFYGLEVPLHIKQIEPDLIAAVDLTSGSALDLTLPSRNAVLENAKLKELRRQCRLAVYEAVQQRGKHFLVYKDYAEAIEAGIAIPEAEIMLHRMPPNDVQESAGGWSGDYMDEFEYSAGVLSSEGLLCDVSNEAYVALLLSGDGPPIVARNASLEGYSWYPTRRLVSVEQEVITEEGSYRIPLDGTYDCQQWDAVKASKLQDILVHLTIEEGEGEDVTTEVMSLQTNIAWSPEPNCFEDVIALNYDALDTSTLQVLLFDADYEGDDSETTQRDKFSELAEDFITCKLVGKAGAQRNRITRALDNSDLRDAMKELGIDSIVVRLSGETCGVDWSLD